MFHAFGEVPWWAFMMMPLMMLGMPLMMWMMMRMMMSHGAGHDAPSSATPKEEPSTESEVTVLRSQVAELQERLVAMEASSSEPQKAQSDSR